MCINLGASLKACSLTKDMKALAEIGDLK